MAHRKSSPAGAGNGSNRGLKAIAKQEFEQACRSVPKLKFDHRGECVLEDCTPQQIKGLRYLAAKPDMKIKAETGEETPVWELITEPGDTTVLVLHCRYKAKYLAIEESKRRIESVGRLTFHRNVAQFVPESDEQRQGLFELVDEQNRLANKYPGRMFWEVNETDDGRLFVGKRKQLAEQRF